jgi:hypothetical protein
MRPGAGPRGKPAEGSDHRRTGEWTGYVIARTLLAGCRPPPAAPLVAQRFRSLGCETTPDARAAPAEAHESLIGRKTVEEVPLTGLSFRHSHDGMGWASTRDG